MEKDSRCSVCNQVTSATEHSCSYTEAFRTPYQGVNRSTGGISVFWVCREGRGETPLMWERSEQTRTGDFISISRRFMNSQNSS